MGKWYIYLVRCRDGSLYTGIATDVARRVAEHRAGTSRSARYLRGRSPLELVCERRVGSRSLAQRVEAAVKKLPRAFKERLIEQPGDIERLISRARRRSSPPRGRAPRPGGKGNRA